MVLERARRKAVDDAFLFPSRAAPVQYSIVGLTQVESRLFRLPMQGLFKTLAKGDETPCPEGEGQSEGRYPSVKKVCVLFSALFEIL